MEKCIKIAIENGYDTERGYAVEKTVGNRDRFALLDPLFWQALGKGLGWGVWIKDDETKEEYQTWKYYWHRFIDHLAEGKDIESFFTNLLSN